MGAGRWSWPGWATCSRSTGRRAHTRICSKRASTGTPRRRSRRSCATAPGRSWDRASRTRGGRPPPATGSSPGPIRPPPTPRRSCRRPTTGGWIPCSSPRVCGVGATSSPRRSRRARTPRAYTTSPRGDGDLLDFAAVQTFLTGGRHRVHGRSGGDADPWAGGLRLSLPSSRPRYSPSSPLPSLPGGRLGARHIARQRPSVLPLTSPAPGSHIHTA